MAQLTDDCFAFSGPLLPVAEAERLITERVTPVDGLEIRKLARSARPGLADDIVAPLDIPPFDNSAVDGYAVRGADLDPVAEKRLAVVDRVAAGHAASHARQSRRSDPHLHRRADARWGRYRFHARGLPRDGDGVVVPPGLKPGANRRLAGEDMRAGAVALPAGRRLSVQHVALAAALGLTRLEVRRRVRVALFSTGDEIVEPGRAAAACRALRFEPLSARRAVRAVRCRGDRSRHSRRRADALARAIAAAAAGHDLVLTSGGVSTGEADHVRGAVESIGRIVFWRVGIKPGRPVAMGVIRAAKDAGGGAAFVGLPGNPVAVFVTFVRVVRPLLLRLAGALPEPLLALPVRATFSYAKRKGRREYVRVVLRRAADGAVEAVKFEQDGAGVLTSLTETAGLVELSEDVTSIEPGATVGFLSYAAARLG